ncbi:peptidoglycan-binding domain-containing protein [Caulobacter sp. BE254]|uniref:peptidoglycan-binding domain-containing protein n=1 Tax=Caulobacter sp. BE254 TaxID=2817720 RepID=UPI0028650C13|nr:peptidoglycan-binding domain-containing protein [Caulobacter sp. BE254]MDR7117684.1 hypothetical protein [Caulobacter sp. BE254]
MSIAERIAAAGGVLPLGVLGLVVDDVRTLQIRLGQIGLLDPPTDGQFGPVSLWALGAFCRAAGLPFAGALTTQIWATLSAPTAEALFPLNLDISLAGKILTGMQRRGDWIARHPDCVNIVYVEGMNPDGQVNNNRPNEFNDVRFTIGVTSQGTPQVLGAWDGTTEPGRYWTMNPMNPLGAARIAFGQYKAWTVGTHHSNSPSAHEALVQSAPVTVFRDLNRDFQRQGDRQDVGVFAINQHWGYDNPAKDLGNSSAGCLVGRTKTGHRQFMARVKSDPRYLANAGYRFMSSVIPASDVP